MVLHLNVNISDRASFRRKLLFLSLFMLVFIPHYAYNLRKINNSENISNNSITSLSQDAKGILWIGTCDGINEYNGYSIVPYLPLEEKDCLSGSLIDKITNGGDDILWIQTYHGIDRFNQADKTIQRFHEFNHILFTAKDSSNNFFVIKNDHYIFYYDKTVGDFRRISVPELLFDNVIHFYVEEDHLEVVKYDGTSLNYSIIDDGHGGISLKARNGYQHTKCLKYCFQSEAELLFIDESYDLFIINAEKHQATSLVNLKTLISEHGEVSSVIVFQEDIFIGFKTKGLFRLRKNMGYVPEHILISSGIFTLLKDQNQDIIWIGTDGQGVFSYTNDLYTIRSVPLKSFTNHINRPIRALHLDENGTLWLGSKGDGIIKIFDYNANSDVLGFKKEYISVDNSNLSDNSVYAIKESRHPILWLGTEDGLNYYSYKTNQIEKVDLIYSGTPIKYLHDIYEQDSIIWLASVGMGVIKAELKWELDKPRLKVIDVFVIDDGKMSSNYFYSILPNEHILLAANRGSGLFFLDTETNMLSNQVFKDNMLNEIYSIAKDGKNKYLIGTAFGLIEYEESEKYKTYNKISGFPNNIIHSILKEDDTSFWLSTNNGVVKYNSKNNTFRNYNHLDGLEVSEFSDGASFKDSLTGNMYFGGINGFVCIVKNKDYVPNDYTPYFYYDNLIIKGEKVNINDFLQEKKGVKILNLDYKQNFFSFSFNIRDYLNINNYSYQYKFEGINDSWVDNGYSNTLNMTNFSPGEYVLLAKYRDLSTLNDSEIFTIKIKIHPPWYQTSLAYAAYLLVILLLTLVIVRSLKIRMKKKRRRRRRVIEQKHKEEMYESKLRFFTNIAHEFCTPLTLIYGPCSKMLNNKKIDASTIKYATIIQQNAERLNSLIQDLIDFRKIEKGYKQPVIESVNITDIINQLCISFSDLSESQNIQLYIYAPNHFIWNSDKEFLVTIITNLLSNAFKYSEIGSSVQIKAEKVNAEAHITISNFGKGIKQEDIDKIFDRYSILDDFENQQNGISTSRNGLGLAISNNMVIQLGGEIVVTSVRNEWTNFIVKLPQKEIEKESAAIHRSTPITSPQTISLNNILFEIKQDNFNDNKPTLLVVDDEVEILWLIKEIFIEEFNVFTCNKASEALKILNDSHPDIILCDINMPEMDGIALMKEVKSNSEQSHIPFILISGDHDMEKQLEGMDAGAELYIVKPFNSDYILATIKRIISRKNTLKKYFESPISAFDLYKGKLKHKDHKKFVYEIICFIDKNIKNKDLSANFIASSMNMSYRSLHRKLKEIDDNLNLSSMIRDCRLHVSKDLLIKTKLTIDEVAFESGFNNRVSFFKAFSKQFNMTPGAYRDEKQNEVKSIG